MATTSKKPVKMSSSFRRLQLRQLFARRALSLSVLTGLGWAIANSGVMPPLFESTDAGPTTVTSLVSGVTPDLSHLKPVQPFHPVAKANDTTALSGNLIRINGTTFSGFWQQKNGRVGIASASMANIIGAELLSSTDPAQQPIRWFPTAQDEVLTLPAWWDSTDRYIDISDLSVGAGWSGQATGNTLELALPVSQVKGICQG